MNRSDWDVIVVGSGFGGSVSTLRLSEKDYSVLVTEKGKRYLIEGFPKTNWNFGCFCAAPFLYGIQCMTLLMNVFVPHGSGVSGGNLVYANTLLVPPDAAFESGSWPGKRWKHKLPPHYETAKRMLEAVRAEYESETDKLLKECAGYMGRGSTYHKVDVGVYFGQPG